MQYYNIIFYISGLLLFSAQALGQSDSLSMPDNPYAPPPPPLENTLHPAGNAAANGEAFWQDRHRTPDNPWRAAHQAMRHAPQTAGNVWSDTAVAPPPNYPAQNYAPYSTAPPYTGTAPTSSYAPQGYAATPRNSYNSYAPAPAQQQYAPNYYPQYAQQPTQQYPQQYPQQQPPQHAQAYSQPSYPSYPNYPTTAQQPSYNAPYYSPPAQAHSGQQNQNAGFMPNNPYNPPAYTTAQPHYQSSNSYYSAPQWSNAPAPNNMGQTHAYAYPDDAPQRLMQRLDQQGYMAQPPYPQTYSQPVPAGQNNAYAPPNQSSYQTMPNRPNAVDGMSNNPYAYAPLPGTTQQATPQMPPSSHAQPPVNPLTQRPRSTPIPHLPTDRLSAPPTAVPPPEMPQQEVVVIQRPQPGTGEYQLKEVLGPAPGDPMMYHAREPDAERPKPGTGEFTVKELLGPAPGDPRAYKDLTAEADKTTEEIPPVSDAALPQEAKAAATATDSPSMPKSDDQATRPAIAIDTESAAPDMPIAPPAVTPDMRSSMSKPEASATEALPAENAQAVNPLE